MVSRQIITPSQQDDVKPHEHDATEISGVFNFLRALKGVIDGSMTVNGTLTVAAGADVVIGDEDVSNSQLFVDNIQSHFNLRETDDADYPDKIFIVDVNGGIGRVVWRDQTGAPVSTDLLHFNQDGTVEVKVGLHLVNGTEAAPALAFENETSLGIYRPSASVLAVVGHDSLGNDTEFARFTADGLTSGPLGFIDTASITSNSSSFTTKADITGLDVTVTHPAGRRAVVTFTGHVQSSVATDTILVFLDNDAGTIARADVPIQRAGVGQYVHLRAFLDPSAGEDTYQVAAQRLSGSGTCIVTAEAVRPAAITVEDVGPA